MCDDINQPAEDGEEMAFGVPTFSDSDEDEAKPKPARQLRTKEELHRDFAADIELLSGVKLHNHKDREVHLLPPAALDAPRGSAASLARVSGVSPGLATAGDFAASEYVRGTGWPVLLSGLTSGWRAERAWASGAALAAERGQVPLRVTDLPSPWGMGGKRTVRLPLSVFVDYAVSAEADDPFYAFEPDFQGDRRALLEDFAVPPQFAEDLYDLDPVMRDFYPQYRHMIVGGRRSGTNMHRDPNCTSAWNTLLCGRKRWICFPPGVAPEDIGSSSKYQKDSPPSYWWTDVYPTLDLEALGAVEGIQEAGDTIFVPRGWWHAVLNLDFTAAITQNLVFPQRLDEVLPAFREEFPDFAKYIEEHHRRAIDEPR